MDEVVKVTIYLTDMKNYEAVNQIYEKNFVGASIPARVSRAARTAVSARTVASARPSAPAAPERAHA